MSAGIVPESFLGLLAAFAGCFTAPSYRSFELLVIGWVHCLGRRTITAVAVASGAVGQRHISVFHRFFSRAAWAVDDLGRVVFGLAVAWIPADQPLYLVIDDTLARKGGKGVALASMHHDPLLSTARKPFFSFGHVWVVLAIWVPLPMGGTRGFALPVLFRLYVGAKRGGQRDAPSRATTGARPRAAQAAHPPASKRPTKLELAREMVALAATWAGDRLVYVLVDSAYAGQELLRRRPAKVHIVSRLRMDAALWTRPRRRCPGQIGRPRKRGKRVPAPQALAAGWRRWRPLPVTLYGRTVTPHVFALTALWYAALPEHPIRIVVVRDPTGRRQDEAFFCTDPGVTDGFILEGYARRWTLEVTFHDTKQHLGLADPQAQAATAVRRTAPVAGLVYALVLLWYADHVHPDVAAGQRPMAWPDRPWYRAKATPSFPDMLGALRRAGWRRYLSDPPSPTRRHQNPAFSWPDAVLATA
jgi:DDE superfamily endonuclease